MAYFQGENLNLDKGRGGQRGQLAENSQKRDRAHKGSGT